MSNYSDNYLNVTTKTYPPSQRNLRYIRSDYMFTMDYKRKVIKEVGDSACILLEFFYDRRKYNYFKPTDNQYIADSLSWNKKKVERVKTTLVKNDYLLILKDKAKDGTQFYRVLLGKDIVEHYKDTGEISKDAVIDIQASDADRRDQ